MLTELLVPLDGSERADAAVPFATEVARRLHSGLRLVRVHVPLPPIYLSEASSYLPDPAWEAETEKEERGWLADRAAHLRKATRIPIAAEYRVGIVGDEICAAAAERSVEAIVCATHGAGGWAPHWLGSVTDALIRHAPCPVLAMSEAAVARPVAFDRMLVLLDGSEASAEILHAAEWFARGVGAKVELLRVVAPTWVAEGMLGMKFDDEDRFGIDAVAAEMKGRLDAIVDELRAAGIAATSSVRVHLDPTRAILAHIEETNPDVVALATRGRGLSRLIVGSVADKVLRMGKRPMLCVCPRKVAGKLPSREAVNGALAGAPA